MKAKEEIERRKIEYRNSINHNTQQFRDKLSQISNTDVIAYPDVVMNQLLECMNLVTVIRIMEKCRFEAVSLGTIFNE